jgi:hypothetical protein
MSKDRNIDDAELANISGAGGDKDLQEVAGDGGPGDGLTGSKPPQGSGGVTGPEHDADTRGDQEIGPA